jgi:two-component system, cell cycle sensor histidine kinase and response regulator CckA
VVTVLSLPGAARAEVSVKIAPSIKVLLCSGYGIDGQARKILARGCNGFMQKPFDIAALAAKLSEIL